MTDSVPEERLQPERLVTLTLPSFAVETMSALGWATFGEGDEDARDAALDAFIEACRRARPDLAPNYDRATGDAMSEPLSAERLAKAVSEVEMLRDALNGVCWESDDIEAIVEALHELPMRRAEVGALRATIEDLTAEREREAAAWSKGVGEFVDEFAPTYCAEAACGPADLLPALPEIAERIRDRVRRAAADTPKLQAAQAWVDARRERDRLLSMVRNKRTRREFFRGAEALDVAEEALAAAFTEEPEGPKHARAGGMAGWVHPLDVSCPTCGARDGENCTNPSGSTHPHITRQPPIALAAEEPEGPQPESTDGR